MVSLTQFIVWIIVGLLGGSVAGLIIRRERRGFGVWRNLGLGLVGALVGGLAVLAAGDFLGARQRADFVARRRRGDRRIVSRPRSAGALAAVEGVGLKGALGPETARQG